VKYPSFLLLKRHKKLPTALYYIRIRSSKRPFISKKSFSMFLPSFVRYSTTSNSKYWTTPHLIDSSYKHFCRSSSHMTKPMNYLTIFSSDSGLQILLPDHFLLPTNNFKEVHVINSFNFMYHDQ